MSISDRSGLPVALCATNASPHEIILVDETLHSKFTVDYLARLIGDKAYDSDRQHIWILEQYNVEMIAPHRSNKKVKTQDGRPLQRFRRRWKIESLRLAPDFRRIQTRW